MSDESTQVLGLLNGQKSHTAPPALPDIVLFDWDDTLYDHNRLLPISSQIFIARYMPSGTTVDQLNGKWHHNKQTFCNSYFPGKSPEYVIHELWSPVMYEIERDQWQLKEGSKELIAALKNKRVLLGVVSNKPQERLLEEIRHFGLEKDFDVIIGHKKDMNAKPKPEPDLIHLALEQLPKQPGRCWYIGDHTDDYGATRHSGIELHVIGQKYAGKIAASQAKSEDTQPIRYFEGLRDFLSYVERIPSTVRAR